MTDISNVELGNSRRKATIRGFHSKLAKPDDKGERIYITCVTPGGKEFKVNEVWVQDRKKQVTVVRGLWWAPDEDGRVTDNSEFGRLLAFLGCNSTSELIGKEVTIAPKENKFMAIVAYKE
jgi:hypothetical protein